MDIKLYVIPGSHPCATVEAALPLKSLEYQRIDQLPGAAPFLQLARFGRRTVPGLVVDGYKVSGSRLIMRTLDGLKSDPRLYTDDPSVDEADRWGDEELQSAARWIIAGALTRNPASADSFLTGANVPQLPAALAHHGTRAWFAAELRLLAGGAHAAEQAVRDLPRLLDHIDELIESGVIGGEAPNAADLQIAGSVRLLLTFADLRDMIDARPAGRLARRLIPRYPGDVPAGTVPADWLSALQPAAQGATPAKGGSRASGRGTIVDVPGRLAAATLPSLAALLAFEPAAASADVPWPAPLQPSSLVRAKALGQPIVVQPDAPHVQQALPWPAPLRSSAYDRARLAGQPIATIAGATPVYSKPRGRRIATVARHTEFGT